MYGTLLRREEVRTGSRALLVAVLSLLLACGAACDDKGGAALPGGTTGSTAAGVARHPLLAGAATADITPSVGVPLGGFGEGDRRLTFPDLYPFNWHTLFAPSQGVRDPIQVKAIVLDDGADRIAIVTLDLLWTSAHLVQQVHSRLAAGRTVGVRPENILFCASHTHSGPGAYSPLMFWQLVALDLYQPHVLDRMADGIAETIARADASTEPAKLGVGTTSLRGITKNRRVGVSPAYTRDSIDDELAVFRIDRADDTPLATIYNFAIHGTVLGPDNLFYSADVMGEASRVIERGGGGVGLFANGADGDIAPDVGSNDAGVVAGGAALGRAVLGLRSTIQTSRECDLACASEVYDLGRPHLYLTPGRIGDVIAPGIESFLRVFGQGSGVTIPLGESVMDREFRFTAIRIGDAAIASVPGEPIHELGFEIKAAGRAMGFRQAFVFALANGHGASFTTESEYWAGGYEALATLYGPQTGELVRKECSKLMAAVR